MKFEAIKLVFTYQITRRPIPYDSKHCL